FHSNIKPVPWQRLSFYDLAQVKSKLLEWTERTRFEMEMRNIKTPPTLLMAAMFAHHPVKPAIQTAGQPKIFPVDGKNERLIDDRAIKPVGQDQLNAYWSATRIKAFFPFVDPGKAMAAAFIWLSDGGCDGGRLQPVERSFEPVVMMFGRAAPRKTQYLVRCCRHQPRCRPTIIAGFDNLARSPDQDVGIPDGRHAMFGRCFNIDDGIAHFEIDRANTLGFGEAEKGPGHQILRIANSEVT